MKFYYSQKKQSIWRKLVGTILSLFVLSLYYFPTLNNYFGGDFKKNVDIQNKIGSQNYNQFLKFLYPVKYANICLENNNSDKNINDAITSYKKRNESKSKQLIEFIDNEYSLSFIEKGQIEKWVGILASDNIKKEKILCENLAFRINNREWDL